MPKTYRDRTLFTLYSFYFLSFVPCGYIIYAKVNTIKKAHVWSIEYKGWRNITDDIGTVGNQEPGCDKWFGLKPVCSGKLLKYIR